jgi:hypothetical protein
VDGETREMGKRRTASRIERPQEPTGWKVVYPGMMVSRGRCTALSVVAPGWSPDAWQRTKSGPKMPAEGNTFFCDKATDDRRR